MNYRSYIAYFRQRPLRTVLIFIAIMVVIVISSFSLGSNDTEVENELLPTLVRVTSAQAYSGSNALTLIGSVRALSEASVTAEQGGRVTSVSATLGATVRAGQVLATIENASERAAVLQAEGVYEAALAAAAQSTIGVSEAATGLASTESAAAAAVLSAYTTVNSTVLNSIDDFFANPQSRFPGLRIDGKGMTEALNAERIAYQSLLPDWQSRTQQVRTSASALDSELVYARTVIARTIRFVDDFITVFSSQDNRSSYTDTELSAFRSDFSQLRATLITTDTNLAQNQASLSAARDAVLRAETAVSGGTVSAADAQVKQALGVLRAAQATLAKTILTTPVAGTVNSLLVRTGDYINGGTVVAVVANNTALEIITFVSEAERSQIAVGDTLRVDETATATVAAIAPAIDPVTRKFEVRLYGESTTLKSGDTVKIQTVSGTVTTDTQVRIPITAIKFEVEDGYVFTVEDGILEKVPVTIGRIVGTSVEIESGLTPTDTFVVDARGLQVGDEVTVR